MLLFGLFFTGLRPAPFLGLGVGAGDALQLHRAVGCSWGGLQASRGGEPLLQGVRSRTRGRLSTGTPPRPDSGKLFSASQRNRPALPREERGKFTPV